ncbi:hypothetical protein V8E53_008806, partial [Lactarius tabidus]
MSSREASVAMAFLLPVAGHHDPLDGKLLFDAMFLVQMAQLIQPLDSTSVVIFAFIAIWNDLGPWTLRLTHCTVDATRYGPEEGAPAVACTCPCFGDKWWYRRACTAGGVFNVLLTMGANLIGFVLGIDN